MSKCSESAEHTDWKAFATDTFLIWMSQRFMYGSVPVELHDYYPTTFRIFKEIRQGCNYPAPGIVRHPILG
jgi:hypothetical protein